MWARINHLEARVGNLKFIIKSFRFLFQNGFWWKTKWIILSFVCEEKLGAAAELSPDTTCVLNGWTLMFGLPLLCCLQRCVCSRGPVIMLNKIVHFAWQILTQAVTFLCISETHNVWELSKQTRTGTGSYCDVLDSCLFFYCWCMFSIVYGLLLMTLLYSALWLIRPKTLTEYKYI